MNIIERYFTNAQNIQNSYTQDKINKSKKNQI